MRPEWVRGIRDECQAHGVPFFFKQWGGRTPKARGRSLDGRMWDEMPALAGEFSARVQTRHRLIRPGEHLVELDLGSVREGPGSPVRLRSWRDAFD
jgi:hypothetical protein